jgi:hypothetical protein
MKNKYSREEKFLELVRTRPPVHVQNSLMTLADRDIAVAMLYIEDPVPVLIFLSPVKRKRVEEELEFARRLDISYNQYSMIIDRVIEVLEGVSKSTGINSYLRPKRRRD